MVWTASRPEVCRAECAELGGAVALFGGQVLPDLAHDLLTAEAGDLSGDVNMVAGADCGHQIPAVEVDLLKFVAHFFQFCQIRHILLLWVVPRAAKCGAGVERIDGKYVERVIYVPGDSTGASLVRR